MTSSLRGDCAMGVPPPSLAPIDASDMSMPLPVLLSLLLCPPAQKVAET